MTCNSLLECRSASMLIQLKVWSGCKFAVTLFTLLPLILRWFACRYLPWNKNANPFLSIWWFYQLHPLLPLRILANYSTAAAGVEWGLFIFRTLNRQRWIWDARGGMCTDRTWRFVSQRTIQIRRIVKYYKTIVHCSHSSWMLMIAWITGR